MFTGCFPLRHWNEAKQLGCSCREMKISAPECAVGDITHLWRSFDEACGLEVVECAIERAHRLQSASGQQASASVNRREWLLGIDSPCEGGKHGPRSSWQLLDLICTMDGPERQPRKVGGIAGESDESVGVGRVKMSDILASN
ncbi:hypothetical protein WT27_12825 [Burkholderia territorii]|uniref:Uncharacterized protein n=1 Tax=Burkholderia territorii TaxID=1503055 RepID=A0A105V4Q7_9BURK|nr:hypothetical protein WT27_12825 [Burkholderia territorii]KVX33756.1 hypothetical protein WT31_08725 [Burkholderia territorii]